MHISEKIWFKRKSAEVGISKSYRERSDLKILTNEDFYRSKSSGIFNEWLENGNLFIEDLVAKRDLNVLSFPLCEQINKVYIINLNVRMLVWKIQEHFTAKMCITWIILEVWIGFSLHLELRNWACKWLVLYLYVFLF